jgi:nucleoside-diphosphate-sugar epimerase
VGQDALVILGFGYTAQFVWPLASCRYANVFATSRDPTRNLSCVALAERLQFDLARPDTWRHIPERADLLWCFPAAPLEAVQQFATTAQISARRVVVLGSTSAYDISNSTAYPPPWIDETAPIDLTKARVRSEEFLRLHCGAITLRVAGIYGPGRNPVEWIRTGRVGPSRKYVNLIHAEDLAAICLVALERGIPGETYNVSDGTPRTWNEIYDRARARTGISPPATSSGEETGKRISTSKLTQQLGYAIRHPDLYAELARFQ